MSDLVVTLKYTRTTCIALYKITTRTTYVRAVHKF
jgi:hypothetical protein